MIVIDTPDNEAPITELFALLSTDMTGEGIIATILPGLGSTPMVTSNSRVAEMMKVAAAVAAKSSGKPVKLVRFTRVETVWHSDKPS